MGTMELQKIELKKAPVGWINVAILLASVMVAVGNILILVDEWDSVLVPDVIGAMIVAAGTAIAPWASKFVGPVQVK